MTNSALSLCFVVVLSRNTSADLGIHPSHLCRAFFSPNTTCINMTQLTRKLSSSCSQLATTRVPAAAEGLQIPYIAEIGDKIDNHL
ncbi:hypothetical protein C8F01DRAFT_1158842, partial [Mycena amicta]